MIDSESVALCFCVCVYLRLINYMRWLHLHQESKSFLWGCGVDWEMVHGGRVVQLVFVYEWRSIIAVLHRCPLTHSKASCSHCGDNSCALRCDCRRKSIYPSRALLMTLPAGSVLLQQEAFSRLDGVVELGGGRGVERSRQAGRCHTTHSFFRTRAVLLTCVYWHYPWCQPPTLHLWLGPGCLLASQG